MVLSHVSLHFICVVSYSQNPLLGEYLEGNFGPVFKEYTATDLPITQGSLPSDLAGEFVRNGPNPLYVQYRNIKYTKYKNNK